MLLATADEIRLRSRISCLMFRVTVSSRFIVLSSLTRLTRNGMMKSNYRRAVGRSWARRRGSGKFMEHFSHLAGPAFETLGVPAVVLFVPICLTRGYERSLLDV